MLMMVEDSWQLLTDALDGLSDQYIDVGLVLVMCQSFACFKHA